MTDKKTDAAEPTELRDDELEQSVGGAMMRSGVVSSKPPVLHNGDPCDGSE